MAHSIPRIANSGPAPFARQGRAVAGRSARGKVTGKLRVAIETMVWQGSCRAEAAKAAYLKDHSLREALRKPHVKAFYLRQLEVLRTSERARNIHALVRVRDQDQNKMAIVNAVKALEQMKDEVPGDIGRPTLPGLVIVIAPAEKTGVS